MMKKDKINLLNKKTEENYPEEKLVLGHGSLNSSIMLIGEAPGAKEVELGQPFVGQAGKHLDEFLEILDIKKENVYITNSVKYRPTKSNPKTGRLSNRTPRKNEIDDFRKYLFEEIKIIDPKIIVTLGNTPLKSIYNKTLKIGDVHGNRFKVEIENIEYNVFPLYHPAAIIYNRSLKEIYMDDLLKLKAEMDRTNKNI